jgi:hypothetical protein
MYAHNRHLVMGWCHDMYSHPSYCLIIYQAKEGEKANLLITGGWIGPVIIFTRLSSLLRVVFGILSLD